MISEVIEIYKTVAGTTVALCDKKNVYDSLCFCIVMNETVLCIWSVVSNHLVSSKNLPWHIGAVKWPIGRAVQKHYINEH